MTDKELEAVVKEIEAAVESRKQAIKDKDRAGSFAATSRIHGATKVLEILGYSVDIDIVTKEVKVIKEES